MRERLSIKLNRVIIRKMLSVTEPVAKDRAKQLNPVVLAFVGDAVYTLCVRQKLALGFGYKTGELNKRASEIVSAHGQSGAA